MSDIEHRKRDDQDSRDGGKAMSGDLVVNSCMRWLYPQKKQGLARCVPLGGRSQEVRAIGRVAGA